jgi:hypothetical protein
VPDHSLLIIIAALLRPTTARCAAAASPSASSNRALFFLNAHTKSPRGLKKSVPTRGFACLNPDCDYCGITEDTHHALVGYGTHNHIQRFKCQGCRKVFTSRIGTPV